MFILILLASFVPAMLVDIFRREAAFTFLISSAFL